MNSFNNGKIYKIQGINGGNKFIGSTSGTLKAKMISLKSDYKCWKEGKKGHNRCFDIFDRYGFNSCEITLIELVNVETKKELDERLSDYIAVYKNVVNKNYKFN